MEWQKKELKERKQSKGHKQVEWRIKKRSEWHTERGKKTCEVKFSNTDTTCAVRMCVCECVCMLLCWLLVREGGWNESKWEEDGSDASNQGGG
jgi:hypothetical protein